MTTSLLRLALFFAFIASTAGCDGDPIASADGLEGTYTSTVLIMPGSTDYPVDALEAGGSLTLTLDGVGSVSGRFVIPEAVGYSADILFSGTYEASGSTIALTVDNTGLLFDRFEQTARGQLSASLPRGFETVLELDRE